MAVKNDNVCLMIGPHSAGLLLYNDCKGWRYFYTAFVLLWCVIMCKICEMVRGMFEPDNWQSMPPWMSGLLMAVIVSILRVIYDAEETSKCRICLEALICGALTLAAGSAVQALGYGADWYMVIGGSIGFLGSHFVRSIAYKVIDKKVGGLK